MGNWKYKIIDARKLLEKSKDNIIRLPLDFDKTPELGHVRVGDYFFACVSANVLKPVEGNECEHRIIDHVWKYIQHSGKTRLECISLNY